MEKIQKSEAEWRALLTPEQYRVLRERGTEAPFTCGTDEPKTGGHYVCAACGLALFRADTKFESGTGWPSYYAPLAPDRLEEVPDDSFDMHRTEIRCARCGSHLGHVFDDGPPPTGKRYCMNSVALQFIPDTHQWHEQNR